MSNLDALLSRHAVDSLALAIQELHSGGYLRGEQPLLRIDNRERAPPAPFQLDAATGRVHRGGCRSISKSSQTALYGIWRLSTDQQIVACPRCKPMPDTNEQPDTQGQATDLLYGVLSVIDQFGGVLRERGQEYRNSRAGKLLDAQLGTLYREVGAREKDILNVVLTSLDQLAGIIQILHASLDKTNGHDTGATEQQPAAGNSTR